MLKQTLFVYFKLPYARLTNKVFLILYVGMYNYDIEHYVQDLKKTKQNKNDMADFLLPSKACLALSTISSGG